VTHLEVVGVFAFELFLVQKRESLYISHRREAEDAKFRDLFCRPPCLVVA
jgi:hypothetical protein